MAGTFSGINTALTALHAQRRGLDVAAQNIANANTQGYTRQRVDLRAVGGPQVPALYSVSDGVGVGVAVKDVVRLRDTLLETRGRAEHAQQAMFGAQAQAFVLVENAFGEPSDTGLQAQLVDFWNGWYDVANRPADMAARNLVIRQAAAVVGTLGTTYHALDSQWMTVRGQVDAQVTAVNAAAAAVGQLNEAIVRAHAAQLPVNELLDQRDGHLMEIAKLTGASVNHRQDGSVDVLLGGSSLVNGPHVRQLRGVGAGAMVNAQGADRVRLEWADTGTTAVISSGSIAAALSIMGDALPTYANDINAIAAALITSVNTQHRLGYGMDDVNNRDFFSGDSATTIALVRTDPRELGVGAAPGTVNGDNAAALAGLGRVAGGVDSMYRELVVRLGVAAQTADRRAAIQDRTVLDIDALRSADAGVNMDEEMTNLVMFQRAYEAAARVLTTIDGMLDTLINRTGLVGR
ncbi:MAG TPA: flagellar hook-associated protein FlgK [Pilimelia sp.]|nr:flagellar hook-associated protein FlgK [Pilimelia sp.]